MRKKLHLYAIAVSPLTNIITSRTFPLSSPNPSSHSSKSSAMISAACRHFVFDGLRCSGGVGDTKRLRPQRTKPRHCFAQLERIKEPTKKKDGTPSSIQIPSDAATATPLVSALTAFAEQDVACFHFPGHNRGKAAPPMLSRVIGEGPFLHDLHELDDLFYPKGAIFDAQRLASELFGSSETWFLVGGTTCGIQASIMATCSAGDTLILPRNSHISAISAMVLTGSTPKYIIPEYSSQWGIAGGITPLQIQKAIKDLENGGKRAAAVLVTSPTYNGVCSNLSEITNLCHSHGIPVIVDEAHGAHFRFHPGFPSTALEQGADLAVQSTHKVLCSLQQSSMLHISGNLVDKDSINRCLQILQSSSPNYLLLASLDAARAQISRNPDSIFNDAMELAMDARQQIERIPGVSVLNLPSFVSGFPAIDPLRITIGFWQLKLSGYEVDKMLIENHGVVSELAGSDSLTFAINLGTCRKDIKRLVSGIKHLSKTFFLGSGLHHSAEHSVISTPFADTSMSLSPRDAFFTKKRSVSIGESVGEICGELICPYPPGIPVLIPGEIITEKALSYLLDVRKKGAIISGSADHQLSSLLVCKQ